MFAHLTAKTQTGETKRYKGHGELADNVIVSWKAKGYTEITDSRVATAKVETIAAPAEPATGQTGRVGKGAKIHKIVSGHAKCGASFRINRIITGAKGREVYITNEPVTCRGC